MALVLHYGDESFGLGDDASVAEAVIAEVGKALAQGGGWVEIPGPKLKSRILVSPGIPIYVRDKPEPQSYFR